MGNAEAAGFRPVAMGRWGRAAVGDMDGRVAELRCEHMGTC